MKNTYGRLLSIDVMRGITIAGMILVNNPGNWGSVYAPMKHAQWNGLTPTDMIFPLFVFIMGISIRCSFFNSNLSSAKTIMAKIIKRTLTIFAIGLVLAWISLTCRTWRSLSGEEMDVWQRLIQSASNFENLRILGVLQRLAIVYFVAAITSYFINYKNIPYIVVALLVGYTVVLIIGNGYEYNETNVLSIVDRAVLGQAHMYRDNGIEPEGLLSTIPTIAHALIGYLFGKWIIVSGIMKKQMKRIIVACVALTVAGILLSFAMPFNKKIWSPSFVLFTCGAGLSILTLLTWITDIHKQNRWTMFFEVFGVNSIALYTLAVLFSITLSNYRFTSSEGTYTLHSYLYSRMLQPYLGDYFGSLTFAIIVLAAVWVVGYVLYRFKIIIKA